MDYRGRKQEDDNNRKGTLFSLTMHVLVIAGIYFMPAPAAKYEHKESNIQVELPQELLGGGPALGLPDQGKGDNPAPGKPDPNAGNSTPTPPKPEPDPAPVPTPVKPVIAKPIPAPTPTPPSKTQTTEDPAAVALRRQQEDARKRVEEEKYRQSQADKDKKRAEDAVRAEQQRQKDEADAKARAEQAAKDKFKGRFGTGTQGGTNGGGGTGTGRGNTGTPGNQGRPDGDPDSKVLDGIGHGPGTVNGFGGRGVRSAPKLQENSQKAGKVVLDVCVDADGSVVSAKFKAVGSTTTEDDLIDAAIRNARQYKFAAGGADKQCGTISYNFIVR
jgi:outer membrane biosynthesis protein TonB